MSCIPVKGLMQAFDALRRDLQMIAVVQDEVEMQLAWYPAGTSGYRRHTDAEPKNCTLAGSQRVLTAIVYCNDGWLPEHGGRLRLWPPTQGGHAVDVEPVAG